MLDAARKALAFVANKNRADIDVDELLVFGLMKAIEIMGEAASKISSESRNAYPEIPWVDVIRMRNRLIHAYADADPDVLWDTVTYDLPTLIPVLEKILETEEPA